MRGWRVALLAGFGAVSASAPARAEFPPQTLELEYSREGDAADCPVESELRARIAMDLGYDPFAAPNPRGGRDTLRVQLRRSHGLRVADLELVDPDGRSLAKQRLHSADATCAALGAAVEVAISVMFDRASPSREPVRHAQSESELLALSPIPTLSLPPEPPPQRSPLHLLVGGLIFFAADLRTELALQLALRATSWSLELDGRVGYFQRFYIDGLVARRDVVTIAPCVWSGSTSGVGFCPLLMTGVIEIAGADGAGGGSTWPYLATGARIAVSAPLVGPVALRLQGGVVLPLIGATSEVNNLQATEPRVLALDFGAGLTVQIL